MKEEDLDDSDLLKGLTKKSLLMDYYELKTRVYAFLNELAIQIKSIIF